MQTKVLKYFSMDPKVQIFNKLRDRNQHKKQLLIRQSHHNANIPNFKTNLVDNTCALRLQNPIYVLESKSELKDTLNLGK